MSAPHPPGCRLAVPIACVIASFSISAGAAEPLVQAGRLAAGAGDPHLAVIDIRPTASFLPGHVPGAISADYRTAGWTVPGPAGAAAALPPVDRIAATIGVR
jgi:3-mercaptopyruvate sulfurtransferase SseA